MRWNRSECIGRLCIAAWLILAGCEDRHPAPAGEPAVGKQRSSFRVVKDAGTPPANETPASSDSAAAPAAPAGSDVVPSPGAAAPSGAAGAPPARKVPDDPLDPDCLRSGCHDALRAAERIHGPVAVGTCDACHEPNPPGHHFKLTRTQPDLCTFCHLTAAEKPVIHVPFAQNPCTTCHDPHGSKSKFMLTTATTGEFCAGCHTLARQEFAHGPVVVGECMACHEAHQSNFPRLMREQGSRQCTGCHADTAADIAMKKHAHKPAVQDCTSCHLAHYGANRSLLRKATDELCLDCHQDIRELMVGRPVVHGAVKELERCSNCHTPHAGERPFLLKDQSINLCLKCHSQEIEIAPGKKLRNMAASLAANKFQHGPIREGDCIACHNAHASVNYRLLREAFPQEFYREFDVRNYALCFGCHQQTLVLHEETTALTGFRDGHRNLHFVHVNKEVKGRTCRACHEIHASNLPKHMRESVPFGPVGWNLPVNFQKSETGGSCGPGCHKPMQYDRTKDGAPP